MRGRGGTAREGSGARRLSTRYNMDLEDNKKTIPVARRERRERERERDSERPFVWNDPLAPPQRRRPLLVAHVSVGALSKG